LNVIVIHYIDKSMAMGSVE